MMLAAVSLYLLRNSSAPKSYPVDIAVNILGCHADTAVAHSEGAGFFVDAYLYIESAEFAFEFAE